MTFDLLKKVSAILKPTPVYLVGGFVRDLIRGHASPDIDLATSQNPMRLAERLAKTLGGTAFTLDEERGINRIQLPNGIRFDLARFKGPTLEQDLLARDFTVNAMALPLDEASRVTPPFANVLIDPTGGIRDLSQKTIRAVSKRSFRDDPLRILRAFRIAAELGFSIEPATLRLVKRDKALLKKISKERIREELLKLFCVKSSLPQLELMSRAGILQELLPESKPMERTARTYYGKGGVWKHSLEAFEILEEILGNLGRLFPRCAKPLIAYVEEPISGYPRYSLLKLSELLHDVGKPKTAKMIGGRLRFFEHEDVGARMTKKILERFRFSSEERDRAGRIVQAHMRPGNLATQPMITDRAIFRFFRDLDDDAMGALLVSLADHLTYVPVRQRLKWKTPHERLTKKMVERYFLESEKVSPKKLIDGNTIMKTFSLSPGPLIGEILRAVQESQAIGEISNPGQALSWIKKKFKAQLK